MSRAPAFRSARRASQLARRPGPPRARGVGAYLRASGALSEDDPRPRTHPRPHRASQTLASDEGERTWLAPSPHGIESYERPCPLPPANVDPRAVRASSVAQRVIRVGSAFCLQRRRRNNEVAASVGVIQGWSRSPRRSRIACPRSPMTSFTNSRRALALPRARVNLRSRERGCRVLRGRRHCLRIRGHRYAQQDRERRRSAEMRSTLKSCEAPSSVPNGCLPKVDSPSS